jgi:tetratricopeptide (TPR) repeat protein
MLLHAAARSAAWLLALLMIAIGGAALAPRLTATTPLHTADQLWRDGRATEAWALYTDLHEVDALPAYAQLRLAGLSLERGACGDAELLAAHVLQQPATADDAALAHLIRAECALKRSAPQRAGAEWNALAAAPTGNALVQVLQGEHALRSGDLPAAAKHLETALQHPLPTPWTAFAHLRLAQTSSDLAAAAHHMAAIPAALPTADPATRPLLPLRLHELAAQAARLRTVLAAPPADQDQLRGQVVLDAELWRLAAAQWDRVAQRDVDNPRAPAYAAYARYRLGERRSATLGALAQRFPGDPFIATLRATLVLDTGDVNTAGIFIERAEAEHGRDPALVLVRSDILAAQRRYADAIAERRRARDIAPAEQRARYALALAQQHIDLAYNLCDEGIAAAQDSTTLAPNDAHAWRTLAIAQRHCRRYADAIAAAQHGLALAPDDPALHFLAGAALWEADQREQAHAYLLRAADLAPASTWRERAEELLKIAD